MQADAVHTSGGFTQRNITEQDIDVQRALRGIHLDAPDEKVFDSAVLNVEYLLGWMHATTIEAKAELNEWKWTGKQTASTTPVDELVAVRGGFEYRLGIVFNQFRVDDRPRANERSLANREWAELTIKSGEPTTFSGFDATAKAGHGLDDAGRARAGRCHPRDGVVHAVNAASGLGATVIGRGRGDGSPDPPAQASR